ncbi:protein-disulfide reductase DsbD family protein, partial [Bacteroidota bacterium]
WEFSTEKINDTEFYIQIKATIDPEWHIYSFYTPKGGPLQASFSFIESENFDTVGLVIETPKPKKEYEEASAFPNIDFVLIHYHEVVFKQKVKLNTDKAFNIKGELDGQACIEGKCILIGTDFSFSFNKEIIQSEDESTIIEPGNYLDMMNEDSENSSLLKLFFIAFLFGLVALLTPCVFPMIPMTVTFFMTDSKNRLKAIRQALIFGFSIIALYSFIGTVVSMIFGPAIANWLSTHWVPNILFFLIFIFFAASFLGMFEITLPGWMINKSDKQAEKGGFLGPFFMAFTLVLVSFSCTGPIVGSILVKSAGGEFLEPLVGMFGFSLAFAIPFTLFALFPSWLSNLPKSGGWLNTVKVILGFLELALGLKFLSIADQTYHWGILDREIYIAFWIIIAILMGFYLLGKLKFAHDSDLKHIGVPRLMLAIFTFTFAMYLIPGMFGAPLKALAGYLPPQKTHDFNLNEIIRDNVKLYASENQKSAICEEPKYGDQLELPFGLEGYFDYEQALSCAKSKNKPLFIDFTGHGCVNCRNMEFNVWSDPEVKKRLIEDYIIVALYVDDKKTLPEDQWIKSKSTGKTLRTIGDIYADFQISRFKTNAQPYYVLLDTNEEMLVNPKKYDLKISNFVKFLDEGTAEFKKRSNPAMQD